MPSLDDTLAALMARPRTTMRLGTSTASPSAVSVAGGTVSVDRWISAPSGAGEPVVLLMQDGAVVASVADADGGYVKRSGDTMTGALTLAGSPTAPLHAAPKSYVDARTAHGVFTKTTDVNGFLQIFASDLGLTSIDGAVASVQWAMSGGAAHIASARLGSSTVVQVLVLGANPMDGGTMSRIKSTSVTVYVMAWGTV